MCEANVWKNTEFMQKDIYMTLNMCKKFETTTQEQAPYTFVISLYKVFMC